MSVRLRIQQNATANLGQANITCLNQLPIVSGVPATTSNNFIPYLSKNFLAGLFSTGKMSINDKVVSTVNDIQSVQTLYKSACDRITIYETIESTNPIRPLTIEDTIQPIATHGTYGLIVNAQEFTKICHILEKVNMHGIQWDFLNMQLKTHVICLCHFLFL